jgi:serine protease Do
MKFLKKATTAIAIAVSVTAISLLGGCLSTESSVVVRGKDGQDVSILDIYETTKEETSNPNLTFDEFLKAYLSYDDIELQQATSKQAAINKSLLSCVSIIAEFEQTVTSYTYPYGTQTDTQTASYAGAGVIYQIDKDAGDMYVITNCHVVYNASGVGDGYCNKISLWLYGGEYLDNCKISAEIVGATKSFDIAVLKVTNSDVVKNSNAEAATWTGDEELYIGETVYAVGNPKGEKMSATEGIISKESEYISIDLENTTKTSDDYNYRVVRTDASINGGNSGGGLFDINGNLVGIVNAKNVSSDMDNTGYALPWATSRRVVQNLIENYTGTEYHGINRAYIGMTTKIVTSTSRYNSTKCVTEILEDVGIESVDTSSKFYRDIHVDDIVLNVKVVSSDGTVKENIAVNRHHNITDVMLSVRAGDTVTMTVNRNGEILDLPETYSSVDIENDP